MSDHLDANHNVNSKHGGGQADPAASRSGSGPQREPGYGRYRGSEGFDEHTQDNYLRKEHVGRGGDSTVPQTFDSGLQGPGHVGHKNIPLRGNNVDRGQDNVPHHTLDQELPTKETSMPGGYQSTAPQNNTTKEQMSRDQNYVAPRADGGSDFIPQTTAGNGIKSHGHECNPGRTSDQLHGSNNPELDHSRATDADAKRDHMRHGQNDAHPQTIGRDPATGNYEYSQSGRTEGYERQEGHERRTPQPNARTGVMGDANGQHGDGPQTSDRDPTTQERSAVAEQAMTDNAKTRIAKNEGKNGKRIMNVLKQEAQTEDKLLKTKIKELGRHQKANKQAAKDEASARSSHSKAIKTEHRRNMAFIDARAKHDSALADLQAKEHTLAATHNHSQQQNEVLREREREIEEMREKKAVDDREREAKLTQLTNPTATGL